MSENAIKVSRLTAWLAFIRPKTWGVAIAPVLASLTLAVFESHHFDPVIAFFTLTIALFMQIITNMENDLGYTERKAETGNRKGLPRATTNGWISITAARWAIRGCILLALLNTLLLVYFGGWVFLAIGVASIIAAYTYMGGPKPIAYTPFGEITVLIFFGLTAVVGTYYLQTQSISINSVILGIALGSIASAVLAINNWRDRDHDESIQRITMAVFFQKPIFLFLLRSMIFSPFILVLIMIANTITLWPTLLVFVSLPIGLQISKDVVKYQHYELNGVLFKCVKLELIFSVLFSLGMLIAIGME